MEVFLFDTNQGEIWSERAAPPTTASTRVMMSDTSGGTYYVKNGPYFSAGGNYSLELSLQSQNDAGSGSDAGGEPVKGFDLQAGQAITGEVGNADEFDCYKFAPVTGQTVSFTPGEETNGMGIQLFNADLNDIWRERSVGPTVNKTYQLEEVEGGSYYLCIGNVGQYTVEVRP